MAAIEISYREPEGTAVIRRNSGMPSLAWLELQRFSRDQGGVAVSGTLFSFHGMGSLP